MHAQRLTSVLDSLLEHPATLEALLVELMGSGVLGMDEVEIQAASTFGRGFSHDIDKAEIVDYADGQLLRITTHREGLYDKLPQALFHRPRPRDADEPLERRLESYKDTRREERAAREFFFPFEQESFLFALKTERRERRLIDNFGSPLRTRLLLAIWPACATLPASYYPPLSYILPLSHRIAGDLPLMEACYSALTRVGVSMSYTYSDEAEPAERAARNQNDKGGGNILGVNTVISTTPVAELPHLRITLGPIRRAQTAGFLTGGEYRKLLDLLADCLAPLEVSVRYAFTYHTEDDSFILSDEKDGASYLGYTSEIAAI